MSNLQNSQEKPSLSQESTTNPLDKSSLPPSSLSKNNQNFINSHPNKNPKNFGNLDIFSSFHLPKPKIMEKSEKKISQKKNSTVKIKSKNFLEDKNIFIDEKEENNDNNRGNEIEKKNNGNDEGEENNLNENKIDIKNFDKIYLQRKRLMKTREIIQQKKFLGKIAKTYFIEKEAELGSDNEEHDDVVKKLTSDDEYDEKNDKIDIPNLINDEKIDEKLLRNEINKEKFIDDMLIKDKEEIKKVIEGPQERKSIDEEMMAFNDEELPLKLRLEKMLNKNYEEDKENDKLTFTSIMKNFKNLKKQLQNEENNDELKDALENYEMNAIKKIREIQKINQNEIKNRIKENESILENVLIIGKKKEEEKEKSRLISKDERLKKEKEKILNTKSFGFGKINMKNSFLSNFKNQKNENLSLISKNSSDSKDTNNGLGCLGRRNSDIFKGKKVATMNYGHSFSTNLNLDKPLNSNRGGFALFHKCG